MPKHWLYFLAAALPLVLRVLLLNTGFAEWVWYQNHPEAYALLSQLSVQPLFLEFMGGWALPVFTVTLFCYWAMDDNLEGIDDQFLLLPLAYVPFTIIGDWLVHREVILSDLYIHPLVVIPAGYAYVFTWAIFVRVMDKLRLVM